MYGVMPDSSDETISYAISGNEMKITVKKDNQSVSFPVMFQVPDASKVAMPKGGYPVLIAFGWLGQTAFANNRGYAVITLNTQVIAADNLTRTGVFYELYPYGNFWTKQTGALMAWSWGVSKILDSLEAGAGADLKINHLLNSIGLTIIFLSSNRLQIFLLTSIYWQRYAQMKQDIYLSPVLICMRIGQILPECG